jgi:hypothetical protein
VLHTLSFARLALSAHLHHHSIPLVSFYAHEVEQPNQLKKRMEKREKMLRKHRRAKSEAGTDMSEPTSPRSYPRKTSGSTIVDSGSSASTRPVLLTASLPLAASPA